MFYIWTLYWVFEIQCVFDSYSLSQLHWLHFKCWEHHLWFIATVLASARSKTFSLGFLGSSCYFTVRGLYACWLFPVDSWLLRDVREGCCLGLVGGACWAGFWCPGWFIGGRTFQWAYRGGTGVTCMYKQSRGVRVQAVSRLPCRVKCFPFLLMWLQASSLTRGPWAEDPSSFHCWG